MKNILAALFQSNKECRYLFIVPNAEEEGNDGLFFGQAGLLSNWQVTVLYRGHLLHTLKRKIK